MRQRDRIVRPSSYKKNDVVAYSTLNQDPSLLQWIAVGSEIPDSNIAVSVVGVDGTGVDHLQEDRLFRWPRIKCRADTR